MHHRLALWPTSVTESSVVLPPSMEGANMLSFKSKSPTLYERLADEKKRIEAALVLVEPRLMRNKLLQKLRQLDVAIHMDRWLSSPRLQAPV
jgi:hypothetical protein